MGKEYTYSLVIAWTNGVETPEGPLSGGGATIVPSDKTVKRVEAVMDDYAETYFTDFKVENIDLMSTARDSWNKQFPDEPLPEDAKQGYFLVTFSSEMEFRWHESPKVMDSDSDDIPLIADNLRIGFWEQKESILKAIVSAYFGDEVPPMRENGSREFEILLYNPSIKIDTSVLFDGISNVDTSKIEWTRDCSFKCDENIWIDFEYSEWLDDDNDS